MFAWEGLEDDVHFFDGVVADKTIPCAWLDIWVEMCVGRAFEILCACNSAKWTALVEADKLAAVFLSPFILHNAPNIDLVFREQPIGRPLREKTLQFYLPDARRFGLEEVYQSPSVILGMSLMH
ncbi:hypothetical protein HBI81_032480 [Parastagonospora nodorum]|nr:hypothetical protein HBH84_171270 [Parastagonospora nodorum]KAH4715034.1 hypothetical protein HBH78_033250 [Parastagonospora nodorum]KAH4784837.1 hypothetical protein HBH62_090240 [Parastagonospora nodorum]KAH4934516.1 hypothetical protein HBI79_086770 [Parastagonospora nodorum]KAH5084213.1 hypothetical protein HBH95_037580 [Parastagonospora nodorum]